MKQIHMNIAVKGVSKLIKTDFIKSRIPIYIVIYNCTYMYSSIFYAMQC